MIVTEEMRRLMRHALGVTDQPKPYRNRFATYWGGAACDNWVHLCKLGLAEHFATSESGMMFFGVTLEGHTLLGVEPES